MHYLEEPPPARLSQTVGKYLAFFAVAVLCFLVPALVLASLRWVETHDPLLPVAIRILITFCSTALSVLCGGILLARGRTMLGVVLLILALVAFVVGMPDR